MIRPIHISPLLAQLVEPVHCDPIIVAEGNDPFVEVDRALRHVSPRLRLVASPSDFPSTAHLRLLELISIPKDLNAIPQMRKQAKQALAQLKWTASVLSDLILAYSEAVNNVMKHGDVPATCSIFGNGREVVIRVIDTGKGIPIHHLPRLVQNLSSTKQSLGSGFHILTDVADELWISTNENQGVKLHYIKRRPEK